MLPLDRQNKHSADVSCSALSLSAYSIAINAMQSIECRACDKESNEITWSLSQWTQPRCSLSLTLSRYVFRREWQLVHDDAAVVRSTNQSDRFVRPTLHRVRTSQSRTECTHWHICDSLSKVFCSLTAEIVNNRMVWFDEWNERLCGSVMAFSREVESLSHLDFPQKY